MSLLLLLAKSITNNDDDDGDEEVMTKVDEIALEVNFLKVARKLLLTGTTTRELRLLKGCVCDCDKQLN